MTVAELIIALQKLPQDQPVAVYDPKACEYRQVTQAESENRRAVIDVAII
jgi:hypothetical protein